MQLYSIRGGTVEELENKEYQIGIGVSLGNKWFSIENTAELVKWSLYKSKGLVIIYVADAIHAINLEVRKRISREKADEVADNLGNQFLSEIKDYLEKSLSQEDLLKIRYAKWKDITDEEYTEKTKFLYSFCKTDPKFKNTIDDIIKGFVKIEKRKFSDDDITKLGTYLIEELPECMCRVKIAGNDCDAWVYPYGDSSVSDLIYDLIEGKIFPEIKENILDTKPKVLLEVR
jgi:tRNA-dependent cyclodipeptide synthase